MSSYFEGSGSQWASSACIHATLVRRAVGKTGHVDAELGSHGPRRARELQELCPEAGLEVRKENLGELSLSAGSHPTLLCNIENITL